MIVSSTTLFVKLSQLMLRYLIEAWFSLVRIREKLKRI
jgi:hypothetical protein